MLTGRLTALHRFLSKGADKTLLFFKVLRGAQGKDHFFGVMSKAEYSSSSRSILSLPLLSRPEVRETLFQYLAASAEAVYSVLIGEDGGEQKPVYFISRILKGAEVWYPTIERIFLTVLTNARRLRPYFQSHPLVYFEHPCGRLRNPESSGMMLPWSIELSKFHIDHKSRPAIKVQILTDFIVENSSGERFDLESKTTGEKHPSPTWNVYVDGASNKSRAGARVILFGPEGFEVQLTVKINVSISNNEAKYEAVIAG